MRCKLFAYRSLGCLGWHYHSDTWRKRCQSDRGFPRLAGADCDNRCACCRLLGCNFQNSCKIRKSMVRPVHSICSCLASCFRVKNKQGRIRNKRKTVEEIPVCGRLWAEGAAAARAGLRGEFTGWEGIALMAGEAAAGVAGMSYFCSCNK